MPADRSASLLSQYALDTVLPGLGRPSKAALEWAMQGHILARAELTEWAPEISTRLGSLDESALD
jgi:hypothetical protein